MPPTQRQPDPADARRFMTLRTDAELQISSLWLHQEKAIGSRTPKTRKRRPAEDSVVRTR